MQAMHLLPANLHNARKKEWTHAQWSGSEDMNFKLVIPEQGP